MKDRLFTNLLVLCCAPLVAQTPVSTPADQGPSTVRAAQTHSSGIGFSYSIPLDWEVVDTKPMLPVVKQQQTQTATSDDEKKGIACAQIALMARNGTPASVIEVLVIPFDCFGQRFTDKDLPGFAIGVTGGLKKTFDMKDQVYGAYTLGTHSVWIERAYGTSINHPAVKRTVETVCSLLKKGAVCWMVLAADDDALQTFEHGAVTFESDAPVALVPASAFQTKP